MSEVFARLQARIASLPSNAEGMRQALARADQGAGPGLPFAEEAQDMPGPMATRAPAPAPPHGQQYQAETGEQPAPQAMRGLRCPCTLVPVVLELEGDITGPLTWQAGQFDDNVRALCEEHGAQLRAFLSTLPGRRWESWQENALDIADQWDASQGIQQRGQQHD